MNRTGVYKIKYRITTDSGDVIEDGEKVLIEWNEPLAIGVCEKNKKIGWIYEQPFDCTYTDIDIKKYPWTKLYEEHQMWYIVTNTKGSGKIEDIDVTECWDTTKYPDGEYTVTITVWDARNNEYGKNTETIKVRVANGPLILDANCIDIGDADNDGDNEIVFARGNPNILGKGVEVVSLNYESGEWKEQVIFKITDMPFGHDVSSLSLIHI